MNTAGKWTSARRWMTAVFLAALLCSGLIAGCWQISRSRTFQFFGDLVSRVDADERVIALTFDDGPTPEHTHGILALLRQNGVKATFYLIGKEAAANPNETRAIIAAGHELGNHTFNHPDMTLADESLAAREVESTDAALRAAGYQGEITFRAPFAKKLIGLPLYLARHGRTSVTWDIEPESDSRTATDPARIAASVVERARPGSIVLLHVMYDSRRASREALPAIIVGLRERGFRFVTVSELLSLRKPRV